MFVPPTIHRRLASFALDLLGRDQPRARRHRAAEIRTRIRLEGLEDRCLLSPTITEFPILGVPPQVIEGIAAGSNGNLWFTEDFSGPSEIDEINPSTDTFNEFTGPNSSFGITSGPDGNLWIAAGSQLGQIDPSTGALSEFNIPGGNAGAEAITAGPDGNIWFTDTDIGTNAVGVINLTTDVITEFATASRSYSFGITAGREGDLWFTGSLTNTIDAIDPTTDAISEFSIPVAKSNPQGITAGSDGNLWFAQAGVGDIGQFNPTTDAFNEFSLPAANGFVSSITSGPDGNIWFTQGGYVGTINPTTDVITEYAVPYTGSNPNAITTGPDGNLWFTDEGTNAVGVLILNTTRLTVTQQPPASVMADTPFGLTVDADDSSGNLLSSFDGTVTVALAASPGGATLSGTLSVTASGGVASFSGLTINKAASGYTLIVSSGDMESAITNDITVTPAPQLVIAQQPPASVAAGSTFGLTVDVDDSSGNLFTSFNGTVTVALASSPGGATLGGTLSVMASQGVATFSALTLTKAASGYTLTVSSPNADSTTTDAFTVAPAAASQWVMATQPSATATAGQPLNSQPVIDEEDDYGNLETGDNTTTVTASLASGTGSLVGTTTVTLADGVARFTNLAEDIAGTLSLEFRGNGLTAATSAPFVVSPAAASQFVVQTQPSATAMAGQAFALQPVVYEEDRFGNLETADNTALVTATLASGAGPLEGATITTLSGGVATFTNLADDRAGAITLDFISGNGFNAVSNSIVVSPAAPNKWVIQTQPSATATAGEAFATQPVIAEEDKYGNLETGDNTTEVTAALMNGAGHVQATSSVTVSGGVATFAGLATNTAEQVTLEFTGGGLNTLLSNTIAVNPAATSQLVITQEPSAIATAGQALATPPVIAEEDRFGNVETTDNSTTITASLSSGSGPLLGTTTIAVKGGVATFKNLADDTAETIALGFSGAGLTAGPSSDIVISPAQASQLVIHTEPSATATAGQPFAVAPVVDEEDRYGNLEVGDSSTVITATLASGAGLLQGTTAAVSDGVATFAGLDDETAGVVTLTFSGGGAAAVPSSSVSVSPAAASKLIYGQQPTSTAAGAIITPAVTVKVEDAFGNLVGNESSTVTLTLGSGTFAAGTSAVTAAASSGVATFSDLAIDAPGSYTLSATDAALTPAGASNAFTISAAPGGRLVIQTQPPATATAGQAFGTPVVVEELDSFGNLETTDNSTVVTAALESGNGPLLGTTSVTVSGGVATFAHLSDDAAGTISLVFTSSGLTDATSGAIVINPAAASQWVVQTQPSGTATAGTPFADQPVIDEEDGFGNLETGDSSTVVTASLQTGSSSLQGTTSVTVSGGIARFTNLSVGQAGTVSLEFTGGGLTAGSSSAIAVSAQSSSPPIKVAPPAPAIRLEQVITARKTNKHGRPVGKPVIVGFALDYSTPMDASTAGLAANYQVDQAVVKRVKQRHGSVLKPVNFTAAYDQSTNSVMLTVKGRPKFTKGGEIKVIASPPSGVSSEAGVPLDNGVAVFAILKKARGIVLE